MKNLKMKEILEILAKQEQLLRHLSYLTKEMLKDGEINSKDIPNIILFVKDLYTIINNQMDLEIAQIQQMLPKLVKHLLEHFGDNKEWNNTQIKTIEQVIDASVELLFFTSGMVSNNSNRCCKIF
jgi:hypothetical protein